MIFAKAAALELWKSDMHAALSIVAAKLTAALASTAILYMFFSAEINTAPETLPGFRDFPQWLWSWQLRAARLFLNLHNAPAPPKVLNESANPAHKE